MAANASYRFGCTDCRKSFESRGKLNRHLKTHTKPFRCSVCDRGFALRLDLQRHVKARHRLAHAMYPCRMPGCSFKTARKDNLRQHQDRIHGPPSELMPSESAEEASIVSSGDITKIIVANTVSTEEVELSQKLDHRAVLFQAAAAGNATVLQASLDEGVDINVQADDGSTALHCAARTGQTEMVMHLIQQGADTQHANRKERTPLHEAILGRNAQTVKALLQVSPNFEMNNTAAQCIAESESLEVLESCIDHLGAAIAGTDRYEMLLATTKCGQTPMVARLLSYTDHIDDNDSLDDARLAAGRNLPWARQPRERPEFSPLHIASKRGDLQTAKLLLEHGFRINGPACFRRTPLQVAASQGHRNVCEFLMSHKDIRINRQVRDKYGVDLLHIVVARGETEILRLLLSREDLDVNCYNSEERTPLHLAAISGHLPVLQILLMDTRVDRKARDRWRLSALQLSALYGHWNSVRMLLDHNDIKTAPKSDTITQEEVAIVPSRIVKKLLSHPDFQNVNIQGSLTDDLNANVGGLLHIAVKQGYCYLLRLLLSRADVDVNLGSAYRKRTALHLAAELGRTDMARHILQHNHIDSNAQAWHGGTPLHYAAEYGWTGVAEILLEHKSINIHLRSYRRWDLRLRDRSNPESALDTAKTLGHTAIINLLLTHGAVDEVDASAPSKSGGGEVILTTPLQPEDGMESSDIGMEEYSFLDEYMLGADDIPVTGGQSWLDTVLRGDGTAQELV